jgi:hypothetical protein
MAESGSPEILSFTKFAARLGCKPGYVTQLRQAGRLALTADGKGVLVAESLRLIEETRDPSKAGVRARHAASRGQQGGGSPDSAASAAGAAESADSDTEGSDGLPAESPHAQRRAKALADKEEALARKAIREEQVEMGQLLEKAETLSFIADALVQLRSRLELLSPTLAPRLAATDDEDQVRMLLRDGLEHALEELAKKFAAIGQERA